MDIFERQNFDSLLLFSDLNMFVTEMDTEMDAMQTTIVQLQEIIRSKMADGEKVDEPTVSMTS